MSMVRSCGPRSHTHTHTPLNPQPRATPRDLRYLEAELDEINKRERDHHKRRDHTASKSLSVAISADTSKRNALNPKRNGKAQPLKEGAHLAYELCHSLGLAGDLPDEVELAAHRSMVSALPCARARAQTWRC
mgnify:CR=1 FL=1